MCYWHNRNVLILDKVEKFKTSPWVYWFKLALHFSHIMFWGTTRNLSVSNQYTFISITSYWNPKECCHNSLNNPLSNSIQTTYTHMALHRPVSPATSSHTHNRHVGTIQYHIFTTHSEQTMCRLPLPVLLHKVNRTCTLAPLGWYPLLYCVEVSVAPLSTPLIFTVVSVRG